MLICPYCGDIMEDITKEKIKMFGKPKCCDYNMLKIDDSKIYTVVRAIDTLKSNLEKEILRGVE
jgi:hypothetical protein